MTLSLEDNEIEQCDNSCLEDALRKSRNISTDHLELNWRYL